MDFAFPTGLQITARGQQDRKEQQKEDKRVEEKLDWFEHFYLLDVNLTLTLVSGMQEKAGWHFLTLIQAYTQGLFAVYIRCKYCTVNIILFPEYVNK